MSYGPLKKEDSLNELISQINDCLLNCQLMLKSKDDFDSCINWFHRCMEIDKRTTNAFINENKEKFSLELQNYFSQFLKKSNLTKEDFI